MDRWMDEWDEARGALGRGAHAREFPLKESETVSWETLFLESPSRPRSLQTSFHHPAVAFPFSGNFLRPLHPRRSTLSVPLGLPEAAGTNGAGWRSLNTHRDLSPLPSPLSQLLIPIPRKRLPPSCSAFVVLGGAGRGGSHEELSLEPPFPPFSRLPSPKRVPKLLGELDSPGMSSGKSQGGVSPGAPPPRQRGWLRLVPEDPASFLGGPPGQDRGTGSA